MTPVPDPAARFAAEAEDSLAAAATMGPDLLARLGLYRGAEQFVDDAITTIVVTARAQGYTWESIAYALSMSRQGAQQRWRRFTD